MPPNKNADRHITNIESDQWIAKQLADATTDAEKETAVLRVNGHEATKALIRSEWGKYTVGKPRATKWKTAQQLEEQGIVGLYWT